MRASTDMEGDLMAPGRTRILRREHRRAWRGIPTGRRATHKVKTAYGRKQKQRDWLAQRDAAVAAMTSELPG